MASLRGNMVDNVPVVSGSGEVVFYVRLPEFVNVEGGDLGESGVNAGVLNRLEGIEKSLKLLTSLSAKGGVTGVGSVGKSVNKVEVCQKCKKMTKEVVEWEDEDEFGNPKVFKICRGCEYKFKKRKKY